MASAAGGMLNLGKLKLERRVYQNIKRHFFKPRAAPGSTSYYVLLPEVPTDTRDTNPVLRSDEYPQFSEIKPDMCISGSAKRSIEFDVKAGNFMDSLKNPKGELTFEKIFHPMEEYLQPLDYALATTRHLNHVKNDTKFKDAYLRINPQVENAKCQRWLNQDLYNAVNTLNVKKRESLDEHQKRLVDKYLLEFKMNGINLSKEARSMLFSLAIRMGECKQHYRSKVNISSNLFTHTVPLADYGMLSEFPKEFLDKISTNKEDPSKGPWTFNLSQNVYEAALTYCSDRMTRWNIWYAYNNRASMDHDNLNLSNHVLTEDIRKHRMNIANTLNYKTFADLSLESKMAGSVENVNSFINQLRDTFKPLADEEIAVLQDFANIEGFPHKLEAWDVPYWRRRHLNHLYRVDMHSLKEYFPLPRVLDYLFAYCKILFGLRFEDHTSSADVWNEDVKFFKVYDDASGKFMSAFYLDPYSRPGSKMAGSWMEVGRGRSDLTQTTPFSYLCLSLDKPIADQPCLVTFQQLQHLFYVFGNGLQQLATESPYCELSGQNVVEFDASNTSAYLMKMILNTRQTLRTMSRHHVTGESLGDDVINTIMKMRHHMTSYDNMVNLYLSSLDLQLHSSTTSWYPLQQRVWREFMTIPMAEEDNHVCSFTHVFSENQHAAFYSHKWSEMMACDIFETFRQASKENPEAVRAVGKRFRDTFLSLSGSVPAGEVFKRFQGREPNVDALVSYHLH